MNYKKELYKLRFLQCHCSPLGQTGCKETDDMKGPTFNWQQMNKNTTGAETLLHHLELYPIPPTKATTLKNWLIWHGCKLSLTITLLPFPSLQFENKMRSVCKQITKLDEEMASCITMLIFQGLKLTTLYEAQLLPISLIKGYAVQLMFWGFHINIFWKEKLTGQTAPSCRRKSIGVQQ